MCTSCSPSGAYPVEVNFVNAEGPRCGVHTATNFNGVPIASTITLYASAAGYSCQPHADTLAHELGHVLGLADVTYAASCYGSIMGAREPGGTRTVTADDCDEVDEAWMTPTEETPPPADPTDGQNCVSPIILDLGNRGYVLTSLEEGVQFDLRNEGRTRQTAWTRSDTESAFLALDRNGNGRIDNGAELFGNFTPLSSGALTANGFIALSEFDDNSDGVIDSQDEVWPFLLLWIDRNHDGESAGEIERISASSVTALETTYHFIGKKDRWGNLFRYMAHFRMSKGLAERRKSYYDVFFVVQQ